jgi:ABC-type branched-subunit amino acid transport system substrate-binding protein
MAAPLRVGILYDMANEPREPTHTEYWLRLAADELIAKGQLDREIEFVAACGLGLPAGTAAAVERAYAALVEQDVLIVAGPAIGDNALALTPLVERCRVPTINWSGAERARGEYMFHLQVGSHEDESVLLARYIVALGAKRVGVVYDRSPIGRRHLQFFQDEAEILGLRIVATASLAPLAEKAVDEIGALLEGQPDALLYLGLGLSAPAAARALTARGWSGPRVMNTAGLRGYAPEFGRAIEGWAYVDMHADHNTTLAALCTRLSLSAPGDKFTAARGYDLGRLVAEGLARATEITREGVKDALERVKWLPAAEGYDGTQLGFGKYDRGALHGRYLVMRQWQGGQSVQVEP